MLRMPKGLGWWMNEDDADLGSGSGFFHNIMTNNHSWRVLKTQFVMMGVHNPFLLAIRALIYELTKRGLEKPVFQNVLIYLH